MPLPPLRSDTEVRTEPERLDSWYAPDRVPVRPVDRRDDKLGGQVCVRDYRFTVEHLLQLLAGAWDLERIQLDFPFIEPEDVQQALRALCQPCSDNTALER